MRDAIEQGGGEYPDSCGEVVAPGSTYAGADHRLREQHRSRPVPLRGKTEVAGATRVAAASVALAAAGVDVAAPALELADAPVRDVDRVAAPGPAEVS